MKVRLISIALAPLAFVSSLFLVRHYRGQELAFYFLFWLALLGFGCALAYEYKLKKDLE